MLVERKPTPCASSRMLGYTPVRSCSLCRYSRISRCFSDSVISADFFPPLAAKRPIASLGREESTNRSLGRIYQELEQMFANPAVWEIIHRRGAPPTRTPDERLRKSATPSPLPAFGFLYSLSESASTSTRTTVMLSLPPA